MPHFPLRVRIFSFCDINLRRFRNLLVFVHQGFWLGLLSPKELDQATEFNYSSLEKYQNLKYNKSGLWHWEEKAVHTYFKGCKSILVGASGGGREIIALSTMGYQVDGFECSDKLVEYCKAALRSEDINSEVSFCPPNQVPSKLKIYDGLIMGWGAYIHIRGKEQRIRFLKEFRLHVKHKGPLLLSFFVRDNSKQYKRIYNLARFIASLTRNSDPIEFGDTINGTFDHFFSKEEIENELSEAGFEIVYYSDMAYPHAVAKAV